MEAPRFWSPWYPAGYRYHSYTVFQRDLGFTQHYCQVVFNTNICIKYLTTQSTINKKERSLEPQTHKVFIKMQLHLVGYIYIYKYYTNSLYLIHF